MLLQLACYIVYSGLYVIVSTSLNELTRWARDVVVWTSDGVICMIYSPCRRFPLHSSLALLALAPDNYIVNCTLLVVQYQDFKLSIWFTTMTYDWFQTRVSFWAVFSVNTVGKLLLECHNLITCLEQAQYDVWYVSHQSWVFATPCQKVAVVFFHSFSF